MRVLYCRFRLKSIIMKINYSLLFVSAFNYESSNATTICVKQSNQEFGYIIDCQILGKHAGCIKNKTQSGNTKQHFSLLNIQLGEPIKDFSTHKSLPLMQPSGNLKPRIGYIHSQVNGYHTVPLHLTFFFTVGYRQRVIPTYSFQ